MNPLPANLLGRQAKKYLFVISIMSTTFQLVFGQIENVRIEKVDAEIGNIAYSLTGITQDHNGNMWFSTVAGLFKFDGFRALRFGTGSDKNSLGYRNINGIKTDNDGNLWLALWGGYGAQRYNPRLNEFESFTYDSQNSNSIAGNYLEDFHIDNKGNIWVCGLNGSGLNRIVISRENAYKDSVYFIHYPVDSSSVYGLSNGNVWAIEDDEQGNLWIGTSFGLNKLNINSGRINKYYHGAHDEHSLLHNDISVIYIDGEGTLWIGTNKGLSEAKYLGQDSLYFDHFLPEKFGLIQAEGVYDILDFNEQELLVGTNGAGPQFFNKKTKTFTPIFTERELKIGKWWSVASLYKDLSGVFWVGSNAPYGLYKITTDKIKHYSSSNFEDKKASGNSTVWTFAKDNDKIWIGHSTGVDIFDPQLEIFNKNIGTTFETESEKSVFKDSNGTIWVGTNPGGLYKYDRKLMDFNYVPLPTNKLSYRYELISGIIEDDYKNLWIGTYSCGVSKYNIVTQKFDHYYLEGDSCAFFEGGANLVLGLRKTKNGKIWVGTLYGLYYYNPKEDSLIKVSDLPIREIIETPDHNLLVASELNVYLVDIGNSFKTTPFIKNSTLSRLSPFYGLVLDKLGNLWIATPEFGIWVYNPSTKRAHQFSDKLGVQGPIFHETGIFVMDDGSIYAGGTNGFNIFNPYELLNEESPKIKINGISLHSNKASWKYAELDKDLFYLNSVKLPYHVHTININFNVIDFKDQKLNQYEYQLINFQNEWTTKQGIENQATFTNLNPGTYIFRVRGCNAYGSWNEEGASLEIRVLPPPWATWWSYCIYIITITGLVLGARKYELKRLKLKQKYSEEQKEAKRLAELDEIKSNFFANISHEFRTPLTLILGYINQLKKGANGVDADESLYIMERNTKRVLHLVNQLLDLSKIEAGTLELAYKKYEFNKVTSYIASQFTSLAEMKNIDFQVTCDERIELFMDLDKMELIINNLLSNAIKFTPENGKVGVSLVKGLASEDYPVGCAMLAISDTGPGISEEELPQIFDRFFQVSATSTRRYEGTGIGLSISRELAHLHHGEIKVSSTLGEGTTFSLILPLGKDHLSNVEDRLVEFDESQHLLLIEKSSRNFNEKQKIYDEKEKPYILIVEDNEDLRKYLEENLSYYYVVKLAVNGKFGFDLAVQSIPELIVSDLMMPEMDGKMLCEKLKSDQRTSHIPFIMLTAKADMVTKIDLFKIGADDYLFKPFNFDELHARIENLISSRKKLEEKYKNQIYLNPREIDVQSIDEKFLLKVSQVLEDFSSDPEFSVQRFSEEIAMSEVQLFRKLKALTGHTANEIIRNYRLEKAKHLLAKRSGNITDVAYQVGFSSLSYFAKCFKEKYNCSPKDFLNGQN